MYRIEPLPPLTGLPPKRHRYVERPKMGAVDIDRGLVVRHIANHFDQRGQGWLFHHGEEMVPFDVRSRTFTDNEVRVSETTLVSFGTSDAVARQTHISRYSFLDAEQKCEWATLAAEGWLVNEARKIYSRGLMPRVRVLDLDRTWTIEDFGYNEGDFRDDS